ncbi:MAG: hypothetical protein RIR00_551 [Pseudomonadota bacterium]
MKAAATSLRRRLLLRLLGGGVVLALALVWWSYRHAHHEIDELYDAQLQQMAQTLQALAGARGGSVVPEHLVVEVRGRYLFQIRDRSGRLLAYSPGAPTTPLTWQDGFSEIEAPEGHWRYFSGWDAAQRFQVQVGEDHAHRDHLIRESVLQLLLPVLIGLPLLGLWIWHATGHGLRPLAELARQLGERGPDQLSRLPPQPVPQEVAPLVTAINRLLQEIDQALDQERRFTADAAHELRTPLAALAAQVQVALRARDAAERDHALQGLRLGLERASRLVEQMLQLARLDPEQSLREAPVLDLALLAQEVCAEMGHDILARGLDFSLEAVPTPVRGRADWLRVLLRNLLDNALRYTPPGGRLQLSLDGRGLTLRDSGPGIPAAARAAALQRFNRLGDNSTPGSGLGLSIVARIAELHQARLRLGDAGPGLEVRLEWPDAATQ